MPLSKRGESGRAKLPIVISQGEPSGIGPEVAVKAFAALDGTVKGRPLQLLGDGEVFRRACAISRVDPKDIGGAITETAHKVRAEPGHPSPENAGAITAAIADGVRACMERKAAALVTAPIHKSVLTSAGFGFPGHTEYLAALTGAKLPVMMLASHKVAPPLRVVPFTIHIALTEIFAQLDSQKIADVGAIVLDALKIDFACSKPRLAIAGLNPHAGEDGTMGREDAAIIAPAAAKLRERGYEVSGPLAADSMFHDAARETYDAALCMYHDQALIPIKTLAFWTGVNVTLGLPIVRTSPDHGTALPLAGQGAANPASMIAAIEMAADIADRRGL